MAVIIPEDFETIAPSAADALLVRESSRLLAAHKIGRRSSVRIQLLDGGEAETVVVPASAVRLFLHLLTEMSQGNAVTFIPTHAELTSSASRRSAERVAALYGQTARRRKTSLPNRRQISVESGSTI